MQERAPDSESQRRGAIVPSHEKQQSTADTNDSEVLLAIADLIVSDRVLADLFASLVPLLQELAKCQVISFALFDAAQNGIVTDFWKKGLDERLGRTFPVDESPCGWVWKQQEVMSIPDLNQENRFAGAVLELRNLGLRSYTVVPISTPRRHYGALGIGRGGASAGVPSNLVSIERAARMLGLAVENRELHSQWQRQQTRLESLVAIRRAFSTLNLERGIPAVFANLKLVTKYDQAWFALVEEDSLVIRKVDDRQKLDMLPGEGLVIPISGSAIEPAIAALRVTFQNAEDVMGFGGSLAHEIRSCGIKSLCTVPLLFGGHPLGAIILGSTRECAFTQDDAGYLQQVANKVAVSIQTANTFNGKARAKPIPVRIDSQADEIIGNSAALKRVLESAAVVAQTDATVLITGETGTGKERIARAIHSMSRRQGNAFIKLNCAAIPTGLLESELFGHEKGAFTGAVSQKVGRLELADKGTLLLDEVGEIPLELQPKLLRVLQDQEFERLGGTKTIHVDVRLIAASNRDLEEAVEEKHFRSDLFYRLHVFPVHLPPLRERREDIPLLIRHFVKKCSMRLNKRIDFIPDEAVEIMMNWDWPGNIRELENFIERSVILSEGNRLEPPLHELRAPGWRLVPDSVGTLRDRERDHILEVLRQTGGVLSGPRGAAARLGLKRTTLQYKMQRLGISRTDYLD